MRRFAGEICVQPWPRRSEHYAEENCAKRQRGQRHRHDARAFVHAVRRSACVAEKDVDDLARHVERGENNSSQNQIIRCMRSRPVRRGVQNFFFRPATRKKERHATERHHPNGISEKRHRHDTPETAHFTNVVFAVTSVNHGARAEEQQRFEKTVSQQMHYAGRDAADA